MKFDVTKEKNYIEKKEIDIGNEKGITLIALITSIIIMLILSAISLNATIGQNGIINNARNAKLKQEGAEVATEIQSGIASLDIEYYEKATSDAGITINSLYSIEGLSKYVSGKVNGFNYNKNGTTTVYYTNSKGTYTVKIDNQGIATTLSGIYVNENEIAKINMKKGDKVTINNDDKAIVWKIISNGTEQTIENNVIEKNENGTTIAKGYKDGEVVGTIIIEDEEVLGKGDTEIDSDTENKIAEFNIGKNGNNVKANILCNEDGTYKIIIKGNGEMADGNISEKSTLSDLTEKTKELVIDNEITNVGENAFKSFNSLQNVTFGKNITTIGDSAFEGCTALQSVIIDNDISIVGKMAFYQCRGIMNLYLGNQVERIGYLSFASCSNLQNITLPENITYIGEGAFAWCSSLKRVNFNAKNCEYSYENWVNAIATALFERTSVEEIIIGENVTKICDSIFAKTTTLKKVNMPDSLIEIEKRAFLGCSALEEIEIPENIEYIGAWAFFGCNNIKNVYYNAIHCSTNKIYTIYGYEDETMYSYFPFQYGEIKYRYCSRCQKI